MLAPNTQRTELKTGQRPVQLITRTFKPGEVLFEEGSSGRELYIINEGRVGVYKQMPDGGATELAVIETGGVIGEMSLLDNLPRSATVKALDTTKALLINEATFQAAVVKLPVWLNSIIKIVVSRLRDANKRVDQTVLRDKDHGLVSLMLLMVPSYKYEFSSCLALDYNTVTVEGYYVCRLKKKDIARILTGLEKRQIVAIEEDAEHKKHIVIKEIEVLQLFEEFLSLKAQKKTFREISVPEEAIAMLSNIAYVAQKSGAETADGTTLSKSALREDLQDKDSGRLDKHLVDLRRRNLINLLPHDNDILIVFKKETISRIKKIKEWLPRFQMETA